MWHSKFEAAYFLHISVCSFLGPKNSHTTQISSHYMKLNYGFPCSRLLIDWLNNEPNPMEKSSSWEPGTFSGGQKTFIEPDSSLPRSQEPHFGSYPKPVESSP
jgi:hypothetical protein